MKSAVTLIELQLNVGHNGCVLWSYQRPWDDNSQNLIWWPSASFRTPTAVSVCDRWIQLWPVRAILSFCLCFFPAPVQPVSGFCYGVWLCFNDSFNCSSLWCTAELTRLLTLNLSVFCCSDISRKLCWTFIVTYKQWFIYRVMSSFSLNSVWMDFLVCLRQVKAWVCLNQI